MKDLILITVSTLPYNHPDSGTMSQYLDELEQAEIDVHVQHLDRIPKSETGGTLGYKINNLRKLVTEFQDYNKIIITDAFDVRFFGSKSTLMRKIPSEFVLMAAERNCHPEPSLIPHIQSPGVPWCYVNGGMLCGAPATLLKWFDDIEAHREYEESIMDQQWFNRRLAERSPLVQLDYFTELFYCLYGEKEELQFSWDGNPLNILTGTHPQFIHANGKWPTTEIHERRDRAVKP